MTKPIDFMARWPHFLDHLAPIWFALGDRRGKFFLPAALAGRSRSLGIEPVILDSRFPGDPLSIEPPGEDPIVVAAYRDFELAYQTNLRRPVILMEHGAGFSFRNGHPHYPGGSGLRRKAALLLSPNEFSAEADREANPDTPVAVVGCPKLDAWHGRPAKPREDPPIVAVSFHWNCHVAPETRSAFLHYKRMLPALARGFRLIGHGHPRCMDQLRTVYSRLGIPVAEDFREVMEKADLYINDCSSTLYEFAFLDRPVVVLNIPAYRRDMQLGLRFWDHADVGIQCDRPEDLHDAVLRALEDSPEQKRKRKEAVEAAYPYAGCSSQRAAEAILEQIDGFHPIFPHWERREGESVGALYVAFGDQAKAYCRAGIATFRRHHPDIPVAVISDEILPEADQTILRPERGLLAREYKTQLAQLTPWDFTIFLDADTKVLTDLSAGLRILAQGWDLCIAVDSVESIGDAGHIRPEEVAHTVHQVGSPHFLQYNTGVIFFRKNAVVLNFFETWNEEWKIFGHYDQAAFVRALRRRPLRLWALGRPWNARKTKLAKYVWHHHHVVDRSLSHA